MSVGGLQAPVAELFSHLLGSSACAIHQRALSWCIDVLTRVVGAPQEAGKTRSLAFIAVRKAALLQVRAAADIGVPLSRLNCSCMLPACCADIIQLRQTLGGNIINSSAYFFTAWMILMNCCELRSCLPRVGRSFKSRSSKNGSEIAVISISPCLFH